MTIQIKWFPPAWVQIIYKQSVLYVDPAYLKTYYTQYPGKIEYSTWPDEIDGLPEIMPLADGILLTHAHKDHCKKVTIKRLCKPTTLVYGPKQCRREVGDNLRIIGIGEQIKINNFHILPVPAYNTAKGSASKKVHKKDSCFGYIIRLKDVVIYHPGDSSFIPEMNNLGRVDLAFIPIDGVFTMDIEEAIQAVQAISPTIVVPVHDMGKKDPYFFQKEIESRTGAKARVLEIGEVIEI